MKMKYLTYIELSTSVWTKLTINYLSLIFKNFAIKMLIFTSLSGPSGAIGVACSVVRMLADFPCPSSHNSGRQLWVNYGNLYYRKLSPPSCVIGKWVAIHVYIRITGLQTIKTADKGYVRLCDCKPKSVSASFGYGLGWTPALSLTYSAAKRHMRHAVLK